MVLEYRKVALTIVSTNHLVLNPTRADGIHI